ncbi:MAG: PDZ domain-containing protein [Deltaproteobacteria bacterium]|nr:PDZ domain-containing protein [Deltaproteobacteria bacterium]
MRAWKTWPIVTICVLSILISARLRAQTAGSNPQLNSPAPASTPTRGKDRGTSDAALEIAPRTRASAPAEFPTPSTPAESDLGNTTEQELPPLPTSGPPSAMVSTAARRQPLPYLGISVQRIESHSTPGRDIHGLEIVSVDPASPAERAGLKARGAMTRLGASGATAAALMAPLDIALMPLLKKTGQLGQTGDLIVAIDDQRVSTEAAMEAALAQSKPGDTIYLTVLRLGANGSHKTIRLPVELGNEAANP